MKTFSFTPNLTGRESLHEALQSFKNYYADEIVQSRDFILAVAKVLTLKREKKNRHKVITFTFPLTNNKTKKRNCSKPCESHG